tara:strand:+ start:40 stop:489 length:450 start_codon:yes stop_codon:yes gene_type:complete
MPDVIYQFPRNQYPSLQIGDIGYYAAMGNATGGFEVNNPNAEAPLVLMGPIKAIDHTTSLSNGTLTTTITFEMDDETEQPTANNQYIFFVKSDRVRTAFNTLSGSTNDGAVGINGVSPVGYYASVKYVNSDTSKAEMYATSCEVAESSK